MRLSDFHGPNAAYIIELYERFRQDPGSVDTHTRSVFERWQPEADGDGVGTSGAQAAVPVGVLKIVSAANLAQAIREYGHLAAQLDPLGRKPSGEPSLSPEFHGLTEEDLKALPASAVGGPIAEQSANALEAIHALRSVYSSTLGHDYDHLRNFEERRWLREAAETRRFHPSRLPLDEKELLDRLTQVEVFERFLQRAFPGKYRFSIEGLDILVPMLDELVDRAAESGACTVLIGMAHRGRLNVLAHVLNKPYSEILAEFKDPVTPDIADSELGWTGDVKYHKGARHRFADEAPSCLVVAMPPNPSHLEAIDPVVEGMTRAVGTRVDHPGQPRFDPRVTLPVLIHGDAAFPGQGVVAETLNLSRLCGYWTGGTVHLISNNQLGFTTVPEDSRSTMHASDLAKGFEIPVVHVNADDAEVSLEAIRLAFAYRDRFHKDFVIDLIGYRRHGHNEGDEPAFTQPRMYSVVREHPTVRQIWADRLAERAVVSQGEAEELVHKHNQALQDELDALEPAEDLHEPLPMPPPAGLARRVKTAVPLETLREINRSLNQLPDGFHLHPKLDKLFSRRNSALENPDESSVDWSVAEQLAMATILADGTAIRMTGQDTERGTFSQHHAVLYDVETQERLVPLQFFRQAKAAFEVYNSPLSENAVLAFEYGYNIQEPQRLVLWEAQYGDFVNNAQIVIEEFIVSARNKWGQTPSLVLLLPHGYDGAGPDHSSGRLETFLAWAAETNLRVANPTTAAQYFHLLRRQAALLTTDPLPLVVMTPKSLLRHPFSASKPVDLARGQWEPVIDDPERSDQPEKVRQVLLCTGKFSVDLFSSELRSQRVDTAIVRLEQLYRFPQDPLLAVLSRYPNLKLIRWVQEEPENMGALKFVRDHLGRLKYQLEFVSRERNSSPAEGSSALHQAKQAALVRDSFGGMMTD
ncbi:MAG: 2-oxoglutarate dehydrogenase E1 component [Acidobacteria bacterium]|nr:MAG: 2-oxoglutarate dehydrogenase E1 component [Acidobacteriota bacterium]